MNEQSKPSIEERLRERHRVDSARMWPPPSDLDLLAADEIATLKARVSELESNEAAYESILGERTYNEVAEHIRGLEVAAQALVDEIAKSGTHERWKRLANALQPKARSE